jgi:NAD(P)-dependent dehydrogenase (short-subunit alcohol dehydrogenase family)
MPQRSVLITGASTGIGRATALRLDRAGWLVFAGVRRREDGRALAAESSDRLEPVILDVINDRQVQAVAADVDAAVGEAGLGGVVNNAGVVVTGPVEFIPPDEFRRQLDVNVVGQVSVTQAVLPALRRARGRVLFVTSIGGRVTTPFFAPYNASKWGLEAIAECLRAEVARWGIGVATIEPGSVATPIWEKGTDVAAELRASAGEEAERLYGFAMDTVTRAAQETGNRGIPPEKVAATIERALTTARPKARYLVGRDARMLATVHAVLGPKRWPHAANRRLGI